MGSSGFGFKYDLALGQERENVLAQALGDDAKIELKSDSRSQQTGNIFVEVSSRGKPSGIMTTEADWFVYELREIETFVLMRTGRMRELVEDRMAKYGTVTGGDGGTSVGVLLRVNQLVKEVSRA